MISPLSVVVRCLAVIVAVTVSVDVFAQGELSELNNIYADIGATDDTGRGGDWRGQLGAGLILLERPIADNQALLVPLISVSYQDTFYWRAGQAGMWFVKSDDRRARAGLALKARRGYNQDDYPGLAGMDKRDTSIEAGLNGEWRTKPANITLAYFTDVSGNSHGDSASLGFSHPIRLGPRWNLTPSIGVEWLSADLVDYYYGVKPLEAVGTRTAYEGQSAVNWRAGATLFYLAAHNWSMFGGVSYTRLGSGITDSSIVINDSIGVLHVGASWHF